MQLPPWTVCHHHCCSSNCWLCCWVSQISGPNYNDKPYTLFTLHFISVLPNNVWEPNFTYTAQIQIAHLSSSLFDHLLSNHTAYWSCSHPQDTLSSAAGAASCSWPVCIFTNSLWSSSLGHSVLGFLYKEQTTGHQRSSQAHAHARPQKWTYACRRTGMNTHMYILPFNTCKIDIHYTHA